MICFDTPFEARPRAGRRRGKLTTCAHLFSTFPPPRGTEELVAFAKKLGFVERWIQHPGTHREHFDLIGDAPITRARRAGAKEVRRRMFGAVMILKRQHLED